MMEYFKLIQNTKKEVDYPIIEGEHMHEGIIPYDKTNKINVAIAVPALIILVVPTFILFVLTPIFMFSKANTTFESSRALVRAEQNLLESFIELKTFYLGYNFTESQLEMETEIVGHLN